MKELLKGEAGVEPTVMKIMAGIILLAVGLGIGVSSTGGQVRVSRNN